MELDFHSPDRIHLSDYMNKSQAERQAHLDLSQPCLEIGADSKGARTLLAVVLNTTAHGLGKKSGYLCHACHNSKCSNPYHHYFGTASENNVDNYANNPNLGQQIRDILLTKNPDHYKEMAAARKEGNRDGQKLPEEEVKKRFKAISHLNPEQRGFIGEVAEVWGMTPQAAGRFYRKYGHVV